MRANGDANLAVLQGFVPNIRSSGTANLSATLEGPLEDPIVGGTMTIKNGRIRQFALPHALENIDGAVRFDSRGVTLDGLTGQLGGGAVQFGGRIDKEGYLPGRLDVTMSGRDMRLRFPEGMRSLVDADLTLQGTRESAVLSGQVTVKDAVYTQAFNTGGSLFDFSEERVAGAGRRRDRTLPVRCDVRINAPSTLQVQNRTLRLVANADLQLRGTIDRPVLLGRAEIERGEALVRGQALHHHARHDRLQQPDPHRAVPRHRGGDAHARAGETYRVTLRITGPLAGSRTSRFDSDPPLRRGRDAGAGVQRRRAGKATSSSGSSTRSRRSSGCFRERAARALTGVVSSEVGRVVEQTFGVDTFQITPSLQRSQRAVVARIDPGAAADRRQAAVGAAVSHLLAQPVVVHPRPDHPARVRSDRSVLLDPVAQRRRHLRARLARQEEVSRCVRRAHCIGRCGMCGLGLCFAFACPCVRAAPRSASPSSRSSSSRKASRHRPGRAQADRDPRRRAAVDPGGARDDRAPDEPGPLRGRAGVQRAGGRRRAREVRAGPAHPVDRVEFAGMLGCPRTSCVASSPSGSAARPAPRAPTKWPRRCVLEYRRRGYPAAQGDAARRRDPRPRSRHARARGRSPARAPGFSSVKDHAGRCQGAEHHHRSAGHQDGRDLRRDRRSGASCRRGRNACGAAGTTRPAPARRQHLRRWLGVRVRESRARPAGGLVFAAIRCRTTSATGWCPCAPKPPPTRICSRTRRARSSPTCTRAAIATPMAPYTREERDGELIITFRITRGPRYLVRSVTLTGNVRSSDAGAAAAGPSRRRASRSCGRRWRWASARSRTSIAVTGSHARRSKRPRASSRRRIRRDPDRARQRDHCHRRGPAHRGALGHVPGQHGADRGGSAQAISTAPGRVYSTVDVVADRDAIEQAYRDRGYESVVVTPRRRSPRTTRGPTSRFTINEGPQIIVDHIIIAGNRRISTETIEREMLLEAGRAARRGGGGREPREPHRARAVPPRADRGAGPLRRDATRCARPGRGGAADDDGRRSAASRAAISLRPTGAGGVAEERFEIAPRGSFEIGRRNLWGKNRSVKLFTRVSLRYARRAARARFTSTRRRPIQSSYGFHEYRVLGTYREPRVFGTTADVLVTGIIEQAIRPSFNFTRRVVAGPGGQALSPLYSVTGRYSFERTKLFDEQSLGGRRSR